LSELRNYLDLFGSEADRHNLPGSRPGAAAFLRLAMGIIVYENTGETEQTTRPRRPRGTQIDAKLIHLAAWPGNEA